jgi:cell fate (sporulation/competence/biofilm development) regulator YlbF (YheA/YmcA/DUF963 family)
VRNTQKINEECAPSPSGGGMLHRVTVHSFHSDVLKTLANIDLDPDLILAFDSHLDVFMPVKSTVELFPGWIQSAATRPTVHSLIRRAFGDFPPLLKAKGMDLTELPKMVLVVPEACFKTHVYHESEKIRELLATGPISRDQSSDPIETWTWYLSQALGIEPFLSPPKNFTKLIELGKAANCVLLDVDVDYFQEMQAECYTPMSNAQPGQLGWTSQVLRLVHKIKPQIITISEAKTVAINDPDSNFSKTIDQLRRMGYKINYKRSVKDDEEAQRLIEVYRDLYENVLKPLHDRQRLEKSALSRDAIERDLTEEDEAIRQYFDHLSKSK